MFPLPSPLSGCSVHISSLPLMASIRSESLRFFSISDKSKLCLSKEILMEGCYLLCSLPRGGGWGRYDSPTSLTEAPRHRMRDQRHLSLSVERPCQHFAHFWAGYFGIFLIRMSYNMFIWTDVEWVRNEMTKRLDERMASRIWSFHATVTMHAPLHGIDGLANSLVLTVADTLRLVDIWRYHIISRCIELKCSFWGLLLPWPSFWNCRIGRIVAERWDTINYVKKCIRSIQCWISRRPLCQPPALNV